MGSVQTVAQKHFQATDSEISYLPVHFREEMQELLLKVQGQHVKSPGIYQCSQVCVDENGTRRLKVNIVPSVPLHLPCSFQRVP